MMETEAVIKLVSGIRGSGKTVKVRHFVKNKNRLLIIDTLGNDYFDGVSFRSLRDLKRFWLKVYSGDFRLIYKPPGDEQEIIEDVAEICTLCDKCENLTLVIEELNIIFDEKRPPVEFNKMIFSGRKSGIELIGVAQRPFGFGRKFTSQAKEFYAFYTHEPDDLRFFKQSFGSEAALAICTLEQYQYLKWVYADGVQKFEVCKDEPL